MGELREEAQLISALADGRIHSTQQLVECLSTSSASLSRHIRSLVSLGLEIQHVDGKGYRLEGTLELLSADRIRRQLAPRAATRLTELDIYLNTDSTNERLLMRSAPAVGEVHACLSEFQSLGRGRLGRRWHAPFGTGVCLSIARVFSSSAEAVPCLGLAAGVAVIEALEESGLHDVALKWPNDVVWQGRKLGGVLVEVRGEPGGPCRVVIGVGLNYALDQSTRSLIEAAGVLTPADFREASGGESPGRNALAAILLGRLIEMCDRFEQQGFAAFASRWREADALRDRPVVVTAGTVQVSGFARGIDADGALVVETQGRLRRFHSGEATLAGGVMP